jgi:hypothetical protein
MFDHRHYVPILRWKTAEQLAVRKLGSKVRRQMTPLIEITPKDMPASSAKLGQRLAKAADEMVKNWGDDPLFVDLGLIDSKANSSGDTHPVRLFFDYGNRRFLPSFIPVTGLGRTSDYQHAVKSVVANPMCRF